MSDDLKLRHPFSCIVIGPSGSGKSSFVIRLIQNRPDICTEVTFAGGIVWCYGEKSAVSSRHQLPANVSFNEGVPEDFGNANGEPCLVILDKMLNDVYSKQVCELFTLVSHYINYKRYFEHSKSVSSGQVL